MIDLRIDDVCNDCPEFEVTQENLYYGDEKLAILTCAHIRMCRSIRDHLKKEAVKNDNKPNEGSD